MGRSIRLFLVDGSPTGIISGEIINWTGHVLFARRSMLPELLRRPEIDSRTGVYIIFGPDYDDGAISRVYIGETDNLRKRLYDHSRDKTKEFWESVCAITSKDQNLTKAHVKYLEHKMVQLIKQEGRAIVENGNSPAAVSLPEADISDMEYFLSQLQLLLPVLGLDFVRTTPRPMRAAPESSLSDFRDITSAGIENDNTLGGTRRPSVLARPTDQGAQSPVFNIRDGKHGLSAWAIEIEGQMVILRDSQARAEVQPSLSNSVNSYRELLKRNGKLVEASPGVLVFVEDVPFSSPSAAAQAVFGTSRNGRYDWLVDGSNVTYGEWQERQLASDEEDVAVPGADVSEVLTSKAIQ